MSFSLIGLVLVEAGAEAPTGWRTYLLLVFIFYMVFRLQCLPALRFPQLACRVKVDLPPLNPTIFAVNEPLSHAT